MKVYDHAVIYNGVFYPANTPIEVKEATSSKKEQVEPPTKKKGGVKNDETTD